MILPTTTTTTANQNHTTTSNNKRIKTEEDRSVVRLLPPPPASSLRSSHRRSLRIHITFDGGSRGNPGCAGAGAVVTLLDTTVTEATTTTTTTASMPTKSESTATANNLVIAAASAAPDGATATTTTMSEPFRKVIHIREYLGPYSTNNQAEYHGVVAALRIAVQEAEAFQKMVTTTSSSTNGSTNDCGGAGIHSSNSSVPAQSSSSLPPPPQQPLSTQLIVQGDSNLVIQQLCEVWECRNAKLRPLHKRAMQLLQRFSHYGGDCHEQQCSLQHIYRCDNAAADGAYILRLILLIQLLSCFVLEKTHKQRMTRESTQARTRAAAKTLTRSSCCLLSSPPVPVDRSYLQQLWPIKPWMPDGLG